VELSSLLDHVSVMYVADISQRYKQKKDINEPSNVASNKVSRLCCNSVQCFNYSIGKLGRQWLPVDKLFDSDLNAKKSLRLGLFQVGQALVEI